MIPHRVVPHDITPEIAVFCLSLSEVYAGYRILWLSSVTNIGYCNYFPNSKFQMPCLPCLQCLLSCDNYWLMTEVVTISGNQCTTENRKRSPLTAYLLFPPFATGGQKELQPSHRRHLLLRAQAPVLALRHPAEPEAGPAARGWLCSQQAGLPDCLQWKAVTVTPSEIWISQVWQVSQNCFGSP